MLPRAPLCGCQHKHSNTMRIFLIFILSLFVSFANAQSTETKATPSAPAKTESAAKPEGGETDKPQTEAPKAKKSSTSNTPRRVSSTYKGKRARKEARGYRIQVYSAAGNTKTKLAAQEMAAKVRKAFPELSVYCRFKSPRWVCRVGDFSTKAAAERYLSKIRKAKISSEVSIVIDDVLLPQ